MTQNKKVEPEPSAEFKPLDNVPSTSAGEPKLPPELPEKWLTQLKEAFKKDDKWTLATTIAGSTVLATALSIGAGYLLKPYEMRLSMEATRANLENEYRKKSEAELANINLQYNKLNLDERRSAYTTLGKQFGLFEKELNMYIALCKRAAQDPAMNYHDDASKLLSSLLEQIASTNEAANDMKIASEQVSKEVQRITGEVNINLVEVQKKPETNPKLIERQEELRKQISEVKQNIEQKKSSLSLQS